MLISDWSSDVCSSDLAEVTKIDNGNNVTPSHFAEGQVGELPIIAPQPQKGAVDWRPVSQIIKTDVMEQVKIITPAARSEEHTSELQSLMRISYAVFCLKKKTKTVQDKNIHIIHTKLT